MNRSARLQETLSSIVHALRRETKKRDSRSRRQPFPSDEVGDNDTLYVGFLKNTPNGEAHETLLTYTTETDLIDIDGREVYWLCRTKSQESRFSGAVIEKTCGGPATMRNARTVRRIAAKYA